MKSTYFSVSLTFWLADPFRFGKDNVFKMFRRSCSNWKFRYPKPREALRKSKQLGGGELNQVLLYN